MQKERYVKQINRTEVCLTACTEIGSQTFRNDYKIQHWTSFDLNGLKNGLKMPSNEYKSSRYWWEERILGRGKKQMSSTAQYVESD